MTEAKDINGELAGDANTIVVKIGGACIDDSAALAGVCDAVFDALVAGTPVVVVHGGGAAVDRALERVGVMSERVNGLRKTTSREIGTIAGVLAGETNATLCAHLLSRGAPAVGLSLHAGGMTICDPHPDFAGGPNAADNRVGRIADTNPELLSALLDAGMCPVLSSISMDHAGRLMNVNADDAACAVAGMLDARALVMLTDVEGVRASDGKVIEQLSSDEIEDLIARGVVTGGMVPKVRSALAASASTSRPVVIASWKQPGVLARAARGESCGTVVSCPTVRRA